MFSNMVASSFHSDSISRCRQIISQFFLDDPAATIVPIIGNEGFSGAQIYRIELGIQRYSLRRWPLNGPEPERLAGLHRLLDLTWRLGVQQIAVPLKSRSGSTLLNVDGHLWQLEPWMRGAADFHANPSRVRLQTTMQVLSQWHAAARTYAPHPTDRVWFASTSATPSPGIQERWQIIRQYQKNGDALFGLKLNHVPDEEIKTQLMGIWMHFQDLSSTVMQALERLLATHVPLQPCLRDIWHDHLLFTDDELTGLIDPGACRSENVTTDLARLLGSLVEDDRSEWDFALNCYQQLRPLSLIEFQLLHAFDISGVLLSGMTWLDWLLIQHRPFANRGRVLARLQCIVRRLENLEGRMRL